MRNGHLLFRSFGVSAAVVTLLCAVFVPAFMTNDDPVMLMIASGRLINPVPDGHLMYTNALVGGGLGWLYARVPTWPWYSLYLYVCLCLAAALSLASCLRWRPQGPVRALTWILVLLILVHFAMALQFTVVATWLSWASLAWCVSVCCGSSSGRDSRNVAIVGAAGLGLGGLIRPEGAALGALMALPLLLWVLMCTGRRRALPALTALAVGAVIVLGCTVANRAYYAASPDWEQFYRLNTLKADFLDNNLVLDGAATTRALRTVSWTAADLGMMRNWFFLDEDIFSPANMVRVSESSTRRSLAEQLWNGIDSFGRNRRDPLARIALVLIVLLILTAQPRIAAWAAAVGGWYVFVMLGLSVAARPMPARVYLPCLAAVVVSALLFAGASKLRTVSRRHVIVGVLLLLAPLDAGVRSVVGDSARHASRLTEFRNDWVALHAQQEFRLVVAWADAFPYELVVSPLRETLVDTIRALVGIGTLTRTPFTQARLIEAGVDDLHLALVDDPGVTIIATGQLLPILQTFLRERYQRDVVPQLVFSGDTFSAWQFAERGGQ